VHLKAKSFFFKGDQYIRYDWEGDSVDGELSSIVDNWAGIFVGRWTGGWKVNCGKVETAMELFQFGDVITGTYAYKYGLIQGNSLGNRLIGSWSHVSSNQNRNNGDLELLISKDSSSFSGNWWSSESNGSKIEGKRAEN